MPRDISYQRSEHILSLDYMETRDSDSIAVHSAPHLAADTQNTTYGKYSIVCRVLECYDVALRGNAPDLALDHACHTSGDLSVDRVYSIGYCTITIC